MENLSLLIGGADVPATGGATFDRLNPLTGEVATRAAAATMVRISRPIRPGRRRPSGLPS